MVHQGWSGINKSLLVKVGRLLLSLELVSHRLTSRLVLRSGFTKRKLMTPAPTPSSPIGLTTELQNPPGQADGLVRSLKSEMDLSTLLIIIPTLPKIRDDSGVIMTYLQSGGIPSGLIAHAPFAKVIAEIERLRKAVAVNVMINIIPPGITVPPHQDWLTPINGKKHPIVERWHLPLATNEAAVWWDSRMPEGKTVNMPLGIWCGPVPYWKLHKVSNLGLSRRIHLVVDLDVEVPNEKY